MNDAELDAMLLKPLPERDAAAFSVTLMEAVARHQARPARILSWIMIAILTLLIAAAAVLGALAMAHASPGMQTFVLPSVLLFLTLLLSYAVLQSARE
jgi:hypothetical protein